MTQTKIAVIAFGGNALLPPGSSGTGEEQLKAAQKTSHDLLDIVAQGYRLVIVHGNGPQVGNALIRAEESVTKVPMVDLDFCVAQTQGEMGYLLTRGLKNEMAKQGLDLPVVTLVSHVIVDCQDPALSNPTKPIGPFYVEHRAEELKHLKQWHMVQDAGRGFRRVVASPKPKAVIEMDAIRLLAAQSDAIIICGGGGGIPVCRHNTCLTGIEGVIDKDYTSSLIAKELQADLFIILTQIEKVAIDFDTPNPVFLSDVEVSKLKEYQQEGHFPPGSMGPKVTAAIDFVSQTNRQVIITRSDMLSASLKGRAGTRIIPDA